MTLEQSTPVADPGSYRDPENGVLRAEGRVWRYFSQEAAADLDAAEASGVLNRLSARGSLLPYARLDEAALSQTRRVAPRATVVVEQPQLPFVSYSYEWSFDMLQDAALLHLDVLEDLLSAGFILKDGSADNVQFAAGRPVFIDLGSIERHHEGRPWAGYAQFCRTFLNPLLFQAETHLPFQPWLRASSDGIAPEELYLLLGWRGRLRRRSFTHVTLQHWLNRLFASDAGGAGDVAKSVTVGRDGVRRQVRSLRRTVAGLRPGGRRTTWEDYDAAGSYADVALEAKRAFVQAQLEARRPAVAWDFGCNVGEFSLIAERHAKFVLAMDFDDGAVNALYRRIRGSATKVLPLVMDFASPSPDQGWASEERRGLRSRGPADMALWLALAHHLGLSRAVPVERQLAYLASVAKCAVFEFVPQDDPMARRLVSWRPSGVPEHQYSVEALERAAGIHFRHAEKHPLPDSGRVLYALSND